MIANTVADADRAELNRLYRQWHDMANGPIGSDLCTAIWKFATRHAGADIGHDVYLQVVRRLNACQFGRRAALPDDLCAYVYQSCRNGWRDRKGRSRRHVAFLERHLSKVSDSFNFCEHQGYDGSAVKLWLQTLENYRNLLPTQIAKPLGLHDFDLAATLYTVDKSSNAIKTRIHRAARKCMLAVAAAALLDYPTPLSLHTLVSRLSPSLRGAPWDKILAIAPRFRDLSPGSSRASAITLVEAAQHRLSTFVREPGDTKAFKDSYVWLRTAALLSPEVASDAYRELNSTFGRYRHDSPLTGRLLDRIYALSGDEAAAAEGNRFWHHCLAVMRGEAKYVSEREAFFGAVYVVAYFAPPRLSRPLFGFLQPFDAGRIEQFLTVHADQLRESVIEQACANVAEYIYRGGPHARVNFVRVQLGLSCLSRYSPRFGKGYARLPSETAMKLAVVAEHAARAAVDDRQLRQMAEKIRGSLIGAYDLKWREFSRLCERAREGGRA